MCSLHQFFRFLLVHSSQSDLEGGRQQEVTCVVTAETNLGGNFDVFVRKFQPLFTAYA